MGTTRKIVLCSILVISAFAVRPLLADTITLRDGSRITGSIIAQTRTTVTIRTGGRTLTIQKTRIQRVDLGAVEQPPPDREAERRRAEEERRRQAEEQRKAEEEKRRQEELEKEEQRQSELRNRVNGYRPRKPYTATDVPAPYSGKRAFYAAVNPTSWHSATLANSQAIFTSYLPNEGLLGINRYIFAPRSNRVEAKEYELGYIWREYPGAVEHRLTLSSISAKPDRLISLDRAAGLTLSPTLPGFQSLAGSSITTFGSQTEISTTEELSRRQFDYNFDWKAFRASENRWLKGLSLVVGAGLSYERVKGEGLVLGAFSESVNLPPGFSLAAVSGDALTSWRYDEYSYNLNAGPAYEVELLSGHFLEASLSTLYGAGKAEAIHQTPVVVTLTPPILGLAQLPFDIKDKRRADLERSGHAITLGYRVELLENLALRAELRREQRRYTLRSIDSGDAERYRQSIQIFAFLTEGVPDLLNRFENKDSFNQLNLSLEFRL